MNDIRSTPDIARISNPVEYCIGFFDSETTCIQQGEVGAISMAAAVRVLQTLDAGEAPDEVATNLTARSVSSYEGWARPEALITPDGRKKQVRLRCIDAPDTAQSRRPTGFWFSSWYVVTVNEESIRWSVTLSEPFAAHRVRAIRRHRHLGHEGVVTACEYLSRNGKILKFVTGGEVDEFQVEERILKIFYGEGRTDLQTACERRGVDFESAREIGDALKAIRVREDRRVAKRGL